jgi:hypothetical protein
MEGLAARKLTSIRSALKIKLLVIGKLANNSPWVLGRCGPTNLYCPSISWIVGDALTATIKHAPANHIALIKGI